MKDLLQIDPADNVAVALRALPCGHDAGGGVRVLDDVPAGHKVAVRSIGKSEPVLKYGYSIGVASEEIPAGRYVHTHNVVSALNGDVELRDRAAQGGLQSGRVARGVTFDGFRRSDGRAATRNEIWIVNTVGCVNHASERIAAGASRELCREDSAIEGVFAFPHPFGCSQLGDDLQYTQRVLAGLVNHPNAAAVLILGLGCENNQMRLMLEQLGPTSRDRIRYFNAQDVGDEIEEGTRAVVELADYARQFKRQPIDASELILGMKCGGSDGFSGITANPLVGRVADRLTSLGGTALLSEVPEMFGAEQMLLNRCADDATARATVDLVNRFRDYFRQHNQPIDENPSPGNKDGGITTNAEKSLGCVQKSGRSPIVQVLDYGERAKPRTAGVALIRAPGNDGVSSTAMTIAGAHAILFTTGRGTPMGFPVPTIKIATNTDLATRKPAWIDFNAGALLDGGTDIDTLAERLFDYVLDVASGRVRAKNEASGHREIAIWKNGVTL